VLLAAAAALLIAAGVAVASAQRLPRPGRRRAGLYPKLVTAGALACVALVAFAVVIDAPRPAIFLALASVMFAIAGTRRRAWSRSHATPTSRPRRRPG